LPPVWFLLFFLFQLLRWFVKEFSKGSEFLDLFNVDLKTSPTKIVLTSIKSTITLFMNKLAVIALGGNALLNSGQRGTKEEQIANVKAACEHIADLYSLGYQIVIGHGNGPQVGNVLLQNEAGFNTFEIPKQPMDICVAETQGSIGYMIEQQLHNIFVQRQIQTNIISLISQVVVEENDPAFLNPTKPVGPYYLEEDLDSMKEQGWKFNEDPRGRGWRRVVASPKPTEIRNWQIIETLARQGNVVIAAGGGGIPVIKQQNQMLQGIEAVIDKDLASATLAINIKADAFFILTDIANVFINFNSPQQQKLNNVGVQEMKKHLQDGQFTEGSMAPKVRAALMFCESSGNQTIITDLASLKDFGSGTCIVND